MISPTEKGKFMAPKFTHFIMAVSLLIGLTCYGEAKIHAVFDVKKTLPLHSKEKVFRDYYVNLGADDGAKAGSILAVYRRQGVVDYYRNVLHDDLLVPVAHMKIILVQKDMSVARVVSLTPSRQIPVVEFNGVMMGDRVELLNTDTHPKKAKTIASRN